MCELFYKILAAIYLISIVILVNTFDFAMVNASGESQRGPFVFGEKPSELISNVLTSLGMDPRSLPRELRYAYFYGGRSLKLCGEILEELDLVDIPAHDLVIGAFINGSWVELPYRVYVDAITSFNGVIHYVTPPVITSSSCLELILPNELPEAHSHSGKYPPQIRGSISKLIVLNLRDEYYEYNIPVYIYVNPVIKDRSRAYRYSYEYDPKLLGVLSPYRTHVRIPILDLILVNKEVISKKLGLTKEGVETFISELKQAVMRPINDEVKVNALVRGSEPVPDGGGDGYYVWYNYVERRPELFNKAVERDYKPVPQGVVTFNYTMRKFEDDHPIVGPHVNWTIYEPYVTIVTMRLYVVGSDVSSRTLVVKIDGEEKSFTVYPGVVNIVEFARYYYEHPGRSVEQPLRYSIEMPLLTSSSVWNVTGELIVHYKLDINAINTYLINNTLDMDYFSTLEWSIVLRPSMYSEYNYTYRVSSIIPTPYGGYIDDGVTNMGSIEDDNLDITLRIYVSTPSLDWRVNLTVKICFGSLCDSGYIYATRDRPYNEVAITLEHGHSIPIKKPLYYWITPLLYNGVIPVTLEITPNYVNNVYPNLIRIYIAPSLRNYLRIFYKGGITYRSPIARDRFYYTTLYIWLPEKALGDYFALAQQDFQYYRVIIGTMFTQAVNTPNIYGSSVMLMQINRRGPTSVAGAEVGFVVQLGFPSLISGADNGDVSTSIKYAKLSISLSSMGLDVDRAIVVPREYDPGVNLPDANLALSIVSFIKTALSHCSTPQCVKTEGVLTIGEFLLHGYQFVRDQLSNSFESKIDKASRKIIMEYKVGLLGQATSRSLLIEIDKLAIANDSPAVEISLYIEITDPGYRELRRNYYIGL